MDALVIADTIRRRYAGGRERLFIVHGNTGDLFPQGNAFRTFPDFLAKALTPDVAAWRSRVWLHHSVAFGTRWINGTECDGVMRVSRLLGMTGEARVTTDHQKPMDFFRMIDEVCTRKEKPPVSAEQPIAIRAIVTEAHLIFPEAPIQFLRPEDRELLAKLRRFATEPAYDSADTCIVLVTDALPGIHRELRDVAVTLECTRPNERAIAATLTDAVTRHRTAVAEGMEAQLQRLAIGLTRRQVENVVAECAQAREPLTPELLAGRRKELISRDYAELLEFVEPTWTLDDVGGAPLAVAEFRALAASLRRGDRDIPAGYIIGGQNGVGKTHLLMGFAGTAGITVAVLKSFKSSGYGDSERNWAKIATALTSAGQVIVIVQEADGALGQRTGPNVHETSKAILAQQLALMGDPAQRGKILWLLDTCRPDKLAPDVKRPGRCERMIPLFPPTTEVEVGEILTAQVRLLTRTDGYQFADAFVASVPGHVLRALVGKTGAQIARALRRMKRREGSNVLTPSQFERVVAEDQLKAEPEAYELQRLIAIIEAIETENEDLIPKYYRDMVTGEGGLLSIRQCIEELRRRCDA